jgi:hypothetical protein
MSAIKVKYIEKKKSDKTISGYRHMFGTLNK